MARAVTEEEKKQAQKFAQDALSGASGIYVPAASTANAVINAQVPVEKEKTNVYSGAGGGSSGGSSAMDRYLLELERQQAERQQMLDAQYKAGKRNINDAAKQGNREAYVAYMQGMKNMPQKAAMYGAGGMARSLANKSQLNYENNRNNIEQSRIAALADLEADYRAGVMDAKDRYLTQLQAASTKAAGTLKGTGNSGKQATGYSLEGHQTVHGGSDEQAMTGLISELMGMGFTRQQAEEYIRRQM